MNRSGASPAGGRPVDARKRDAIVACAWELYLAHGVAAVAMETVAAEAGVSKVTVYKHFPDKAALLEAGVLAEMERIEAAQQVRSSADGDEPGQGLAERLGVFGRGIMHFLASPNAIAFYSTLAGELARHPRLAHRFWDVGPGRTRANLTAVIADAVNRGELDAPDPGEAADHLFGLWQGFTNFQFALGVGDDSDIDTRVGHAVDRFLRAYAPDPKTRG